MVLGEGCKWLSNGEDTKELRIEERPKTKGK